MGRRLLADFLSGDKGYNFLLDRHSKEACVVQRMRLPGHEDHPWHRGPVLA
jgi:hypothetical protein